MKRILLLLLALVCLNGCTPEKIPVKNPPDSVPQETPPPDTSAPETEPPAFLPEEPDIMGFVSSNLLQGGYLAGDVDGWIYYRQENLPGEPPSLWKAREDGSGAVKLTDDPPESINVLDGWVYYLLSDSRHIVRVRTDGTDRQVLLTENCTLLHAAGSGLYFNRWNASGKQSDLVHMTPEDRVCTVLLENAELQAYYDGSVYAWQDGALLRYTLRTGEIKILQDCFSYNGGRLADADGFYYYGTETWSFNSFLYYRSGTDGFSQSTDFPFLTIYQNKPLGIAVSDTGSSILVQTEVMKWKNTEMTVLAALSDIPYDTAGNPIEDPNHTDGYREVLGLPYLVGDSVYLWGTRLREGLVFHGQLSCIAQLRDSTVVFWH